MGRAAHLLEMRGLRVELGRVRELQEEVGQALAQALERGLAPPAVEEVGLAVDELDDVARQVALKLFHCPLDLRAQWARWVDGCVGSSGGSGRGWLGTRCAPWELRRPGCSGAKARAALGTRRRSALGAYVEQDVEALVGGEERQAQPLVELLQLLRAGRVRRVHLRGSAGGGWWDGAGAGQETGRGQGRQRMS